MSHKHFCDFTGHLWECEGMALRPLAGDTEPSVCMCDTCQVPMEFGNHSGCMVELLACPEHRDAQLRAMQENRDDKAEQVWVCPKDNVCLGCGLPTNTHDYQQCLRTGGSGSMNKQHNVRGATVTGTCEYWINMEECCFHDLASPESMPQPIYCGKPAKFSRILAEGTRQALCLRHRIHLFRIHISVTAEDWIQDHIYHGFCWCGWFDRRK
jgi:hypothetical protein